MKKDKKKMTRCVVVAIVCLSVMASCGPLLECDANIVIAGDFKDRLGSTWIDYEFIETKLIQFIELAQTTKDDRINTKEKVCKSLKKRYRLYTYQTESFLNHNRSVAGFTECWSGLIVLGKPKIDGESGMIHELFHVAQNCEPTLPIDPGQDADHSNWERAEIYKTLN